MIQINGTCDRDDQRGSIPVGREDGTGPMIAGDVTKLYLLTNAAWAGISRLAGGAERLPPQSRGSGRPLTL